MEAIDEKGLLKESIILMEKKLAKKLFLANNDYTSKDSEIKKNIHGTSTENNELYFRYKERAEIDYELNLAHKELAFLYEEKAKRASELVIANVELAFQSKEKKKRSSELFIVNKELEFQKKENEKRAVELIIANRELDFQKLEMSIRESELLIANKKIIFKTQERQIKTAELNIANRDLIKFEQKQKEYLGGLEEMMFMTSHKVRQPIANILGLSNLLDQLIDSPEELKQTVLCIKEAELTLDLYTRELTAFICELQNEKNIKKE